MGPKIVRNFVTLRVPPTFYMIPYNFASWTPNLDPTWPQLGPNLGPSWAQNRSKIALAYLLTDLHFSTRKNAYLHRFCIKTYTLHDTTTTTTTTNFANTKND